MSDPVKEQLSALVDGELRKGELELLLKRVERDADLRAAVGRYSLISEAMKGEASMLASSGFADRVMAAIDQEPAGAAAKPAFGLTPRLTHRLRTAGGVAIAAGVAALAVVSVQRNEIAPAALVADESAAPTPQQTFVVADSEPSYIVPANTNASAFVPATRLTNYVVAHSEYSSPLGRRSVLSGVLSEDDHDLQTPAEAPVVDVKTQVTQP